MGALYGFQDPGDDGDERLLQVEPELNVELWARPNLDVHDRLATCNDRYGSRRVNPNLLSLSKPLVPPRLH